MRIVLAATLLVAAAATAAAGPCARGKAHRCTVRSATINFNFDPTPTKAVAIPSAAAKKPAFAPPAATPYNGPAFGIPPTGRGATIGYHWSTD